MGTGPRACSRLTRPGREKRFLPRQSAETRLVGPPLAFSPSIATTDRELSFLSHAPRVCFLVPSRLPDFHSLPLLAMVRGSLAVTPVASAAAVTESCKPAPPREGLMGLIGQRSARGFPLGGVFRPVAPSHQRPLNSSCLTQVPLASDREMEAGPCSVTVAFE